MKNYKKTVVFLCAFLLTAISVPAHAYGWGHYKSFQSANFHDFATGAVIQPSAGTLTRSRNSIKANLAISGLEFGSAYTIWWIIWNDPSVCAGSPCGLGDLGKPGSAVIYATGFVTGEGGSASVIAELDAGRLPRGMYVHPGVPGILKYGHGHRVEAHMLVQGHGPINILGEANIQITVDGGACDPVVGCSAPQAIAFLPMH